MLQDPPTHVTGRRTVQSMSDPGYAIGSWTCYGVSGYPNEYENTSVTSDVSGARFRVLDHDTSLDYVAGSGAFNRVEVFGACCRAKSMLQVLYMFHVTGPFECYSMGPVQVTGSRAYYSDLCILQNPEHDICSMSLQGSEHVTESGSCQRILAWSQSPESSEHHGHTDSFFYSPLQLEGQVFFRTDSFHQL